MSKYQVTIMVEGKSRLPLVQTLLADAVGEMQVDWDASDHSALIGAMSILIMRRRPVLLVVNSDSPYEPAKGEYRRSVLHEGLYQQADREFWEVAIADPNIEAWRVNDADEAAKLIAKTPDLQVAVDFLHRIKNGAVIVPEW
jgi:hypothetical protein